MPVTLKALGYAGLIPFIGLTLLSIVMVESRMYEDALALYGFGIFTFLCGAWWPATDMQHAKPGPMILSNGLFLVGFFSYLFVPGHWLALGALLLTLLWCIERYSGLIPQAPKAYTNMRATLTVVASLSMLTTFFCKAG